MNWPVSSLKCDNAGGNAFYLASELNTFRLPADVNSPKEDNCEGNLLNSNGEKAEGQTVESNEAPVCEVHLKKGRGWVTKQQGGKKWWMWKLACSILLNCMNNMYMRLRGPVCLMSADDPVDGVLCLFSVKEINE